MFLEEIIGKEFETWREGQIVILDTPTGSGKTTFIEEKYRKFALSARKRILYCVNRRILKEQMLARQQERIFEEEEKLKRMPFWAQDIRRENGNFVISTYQEIEFAIVTQNKYACNFFASFDIAILDECHYFLADAMFNTNTGQSFSFLIENYRNKRLICMSASMQNFYRLLIDYLNITPQKSYLAIEGMFSPFVYKRIEPEYSGMNFLWFRDYQEMIGRISELPDNEKIMIFVLSIKEGKYIFNLLKEAKIKGQTYLFTSESVQSEKGTALKEELVMRQQYSCRILITTALIDVGINIMDDSVRHIFLLQDNRESLLQMLGRRRLEPGEEINVYLAARDRTFFSKRLRQMKYELGFMNSVAGHFGHHGNTYSDIWIASDFFDSEKASVLRKFVGLWRFPNSNPRYFLNQWSFFRAWELIDEYTTIIEEFDKSGMEAFVLHQAVWLGMDIKDFKTAVPANFADSIVHFLSVYTDVTMNTEEFDNFREAFMPILHQADKIAFPRMTELAKWQKINAFLEKNGIPFFIQRNAKKRNSSDGRSYVIRNLEQEVQNA